MIDIFIEDETNKLNDDLRLVIKKVIDKVVDNENFNNNSEVDILITNNDKIKSINKKFRNIDMPTDVLSFPMDDFDENGILGDIVISFDKAKEQSKSYNHSLERELGFLTAHGMLHLFGYDHINPDDEEVMFKKQEEILSSLNLTR